MSEPYINHVALSLDGASTAVMGCGMRWKPREACEVAAVAPAGVDQNHVVVIPGRQIGPDARESA